MSRDLTLDFLTNDKAKIKNDHFLFFFGLFVAAGLSPSLVFSPELAPAGALVRTFTQPSSSSSLSIRVKG